MKENFILDPNFLGKHLTVVPDVKTDRFDISGSNQKRLMLVCTISDKNAHADFLSKILKAVHYDLTQDVVWIALTDKQDFRFIDWQSTWQPKHFISFGLPPMQTGLNFNERLYHIFELGECRFLFSDSLEAISQDKAKKGALWEKLQEMFF